MGLIFGLVILNKQHLSVSFTLPIYKRILNIPLEHSDLEYIDYQLYQNLQTLKYLNYH